MAAVQMNRRMVKMKDFSLFTSEKIGCCWEWPACVLTDYGAASVYVLRTTTDRAFALTTSN